MFNEGVSETTIPSLVEQTYLGNKKILSALLRSKPGERIFTFAQDEVSNLGRKDTEIFYRRLVAGLSRDDIIWDQDRREGALILLPFVDFQKLEPGQVAIPYLSAIQSQSRDSDPYGSVDVLLQAGDTIIPLLPENYRLTPDIFNSLEEMVWRLPADGQKYAAEEKNKLFRSLGQPNYDTWTKLPKEMPLVLRTGAEVSTGRTSFSKTTMDFKDLLEASSRDRNRAPLTFDHVQSILEVIAGKRFPKTVTDQINFANLKRWEAIWDPGAPSLLLIGSDNTDERTLRIEDATGTICILRGLDYQGEGQPTKVVLNSIRAVGISTQEPRIIEFSYENPSYLKRQPYTNPDHLRLSHVGFSVSPKEITENKRFLLGDDGIYNGNAVIGKDGKVLYTPHYWTFPIRTSIANLFDWNSNFYAGSLITEGMQRLTPDHRRQVRTEYECFWAREISHRLYLGGEYNDPLYKKGFYSKVEEQSVSFGRAANVGRGKRKIIPWEIDLPINIY